MADPCALMPSILCAIIGSFGVLFEVDLTRCLTRSLRATLAAKRHRV